PRRRSDSLERMRFELVRQRQLCSGVIDSNPAGGTTSASATNRHVWPSRQSADFQNGQPNRCFHRGVVRITDPEPPVADEKVADLRADQHHPNQTKPGVAHTLLQLSTSSS